MNALVQDLRYALRLLRRSPGFSLVAILTLGLGIGANTAIFSMLDQALVRSLPVLDPHELVLVSDTGPNSGRGEVLSEVARPFSYPMYEDFREDNGGVFSGVIARFPATVHVSVSGETLRVGAELLSGNAFDVLGLVPHRGRLLGVEDDRLPGGHPVVVVSHAFWSGQLGADPGIVGRTLRINDAPMEIVGVAPRGFDGLEPGNPMDLFVPMMMKQTVTPTWNGLDERRSFWVQVLARLAPGTTLEEAAAGLNVRYAAILKDEIQQIDSTSASFREEFLAKQAQLLPGQQGVPDLKRRLTTPLVVLLGMVGLVLLIACANVANLLLARASTRRREVAIRLALGAGRARLVRQLLVESLVLALAGALVGVVLSTWTASALIGVMPLDDAGRVFSTEPNLRVAVFTLLAALLTAVAAGLVPALQSSRPELVPALKADTAGSVGLGPLRLRKGLVVAQVALSLLLLVGAGLFARSLDNLRSLDPGFRTEQILSFSVAPGLNGYDAERKRAVYARLLDELGAVPGVSGVTLIQEPLIADSNWRSSVSVAGYESSDGEDMAPNFNAVGPDFFSVMDVPLLRGREFDARDTAEAPKVAVVNETFARYFFGDENPIGRRFGRGPQKDEHAIEIVGLVADGKASALREEPRRNVYVPYDQGLDVDGLVFYVRSSLDTAALASTVRETVGRVDPALPPDDVRTLEAQIERSLSLDRLVALLSAAFGLLATVLAAVGLYGVMSYAVARRTREIGVRVALGAERKRILQLVLGEVAVLTGLGLALGLPGGWALGRLVESQLFGVSAADPVPFVVALVTLSLAAAVAGLVPASRAVRVDPAIALRYE